MKNRILRAAAVLTLCLALFPGCGRNEPLEAARPAGRVQPAAAVQNAPNIGRAEAEATVRNTLRNGARYRIRLVSDRMEYAGREYYRFSLSDGGKTVFPAVIVSRDNGEIFSYESGRAAVPVYQDPAFRTGE